MPLGHRCRNLGKVGKCPSAPTPRPLPPRRRGEMLGLFQQPARRLGGWTGWRIPSVSHRRKGKPIRDFRKAWEKACGKVPLGTAARNVLPAGIPEQVAMMISGQKPWSVFGRYDLVSEEDLGGAARNLEGTMLTGTQAGAQATRSLPVSAHPAAEIRAECWCRAGGSNPHGSEPTRV